MSIDLNGLDDALPYDFCTPVDLPSRDMIANIGTSEHVEIQKGVFENIHNLSHKRMVHWVSYKHMHTTYSFYGYRLAFFEQLAELNKYTIETLYLEKTFKEWTLVCVSFCKKNSKRPFALDDSLQLTFNPEGDGCVSNR